MSLFTLFARVRHAWLQGGASFSPEFIAGGLQALELAAHAFGATPILSQHRQLDQTQRELEDVSYELTQCRAELVALKAQTHNVRALAAQATQFQSELARVSKRLAGLEAAPPQKREFPAQAPVLTQEQLLSPSRTSARTPMEINQRTELRRLTTLMATTPLAERLDGQVHSSLLKLIGQLSEVDLEGLRQHPTGPVQELAYTLGHLSRAYAQWEESVPGEGAATTEL